MHDTEGLTGSIIKSYEKHRATSRLHKEDMLNRAVVIEMIDEIRKLLFPGFFDNNQSRAEFRKYVVGERLEYIHHNLSKQACIAMSACHAYPGKCTGELHSMASDAIYEFLNRLPMIRDYLATDVDATFDGDPAAYSTDEIIFSYPGIYAITVYRIAHELTLLNIPMIPRIMTEHAHSITGIDINPGATIGKYFFIDHGTGIVIGETTVIGDNVKIYQGVTLGALSTRKGQRLKGIKRHPTIGNNVTIYSGTTILGGDTVIGDGATIGGNTFIVESVEAGMTVSIKNPDLLFVNNTSKKEAKDD